MQFYPIARGPDAFQQSLTSEQIQAVCEQAFGEGTGAVTVHELGGGEFNNVYLLRFSGGGPEQRATLRVAPPPERVVPWHEEHLMRREHAIQPYFAAIAPLLPRTLVADFTRTVIPRDYLFQTVMPGEPWSDRDGKLAPEQEEPLWRELARIARTIYSVEGETFGHPYPGRQHPTWSATVLDWLERCARDAEREGLDAGQIRGVRDTACARAELLDEIERPQLCHGDLWSFNVLIDRNGYLTGDPPRISAVLDYDRAYWGDPMADWTFHLLPRRASPRVQAIFWDEYGRPADTPSARLRTLIYDGLNIGNALSHAARRGNTRLAATAQAMMEQVVAGLRDFAG
jgi:aminoglycoside phosphotransferase (APT) family kinase protein